MGVTQKLGTIPLAILTDASNNVGIGAAPSGSYKLEVTGTAKVSSTLLVSGAATFSSSVTATQGKFSGSRPQGIFTENGTSGLYLRDATGTGYKSWSIGTNDIVVGFAITPSTAVGGTTFTTPSFVINESGNVGIGTSSPSSALDVRTASGNTYLNIGRASQTTGQVALQLSGGTSGVDWIMYQGSSSNDLQFYGNGAERMRITSGGDVGIGDAGSSATRLTIKGSGATSATNAIAIYNSSATTLFYMRNDGLIYTGTAALSPYNYGGGSSILYVGSSGQLGVGSSTRESKTNIQYLNDVSWLLSLKPASFNKWERDEEGNFTDQYDPITNYGLIADDVEEVKSDFVFYDQNNKLAGVHYDRLIAPILKLVQEQQAQIQELNERLNKAGL